MANESLRIQVRLIGLAVPPRQPARELCPVLAVHFTPETTSVMEASQPSIDRCQLVLNPRPLPPDTSSHGVSLPSEDSLWVFIEWDVDYMVGF